MDLYDYGITVHRKDEEVRSTRLGNENTIILGEIKLS